MTKFKFKPLNKKVQEHNVGNIKNFTHSEATHIIDNVIEQKRGEGGFGHTDVK